MGSKEEDLKALERFIGQVSSSDIKKDLDKVLFYHKMFVSPEIDEERIFQVLIESISQVLNVGRVSLMLIDRTQQALRIRVAKGLREDILKEARVRIGESISGWVALWGEPLLVENIDRFPQFSSSLRTNYNNNSFLSIPVKFMETVIGVVNVSNKNDGSVFREEDLAKLQEIVEVAIMRLKDSLEFKKLLNIGRRKSNFLYVLRHELSGPLGSSIEALKLLSEMKDEAQKKKYLSLVEANLQRTKSLIKNLDYVYEPESASLNRKEIDINSLLDKVISLWSLKASLKKINIFFRPHQQVLKVFVDEEKMFEALSNIVDNAIKYNREGGAVYIETDQNSDYIVIKVEDTGRGISPEIKERIFEEFFTSSDQKEDFKSLGLGLYMTRKILDLHQAKLSWESKKDKGSIFRVEIPRV